MGDFGIGYEAHGTTYTIEARLTRGARRYYTMRVTQAGALVAHGAT